MRASQTWVCPCRPLHRQATGRHSRQSLLESSLDPDDDDSYIAPELAEYLQRAVVAADSKQTRPTSPRPKQTLGSYSIPLSMPKAFQQAHQNQPSIAASPSQQQSPQSEGVRMTSPGKQPQQSTALEPQTGNAASTSTPHQGSSHAPSTSNTGASTAATQPGPPPPLCMGVDDIYWVNQLQAALMQQVNLGYHIMDCHVVYA